MSEAENESIIQSWVDWYAVEWERTGAIAERLASRTGVSLEAALQFMHLSVALQMKRGFAEAWSLQKPVLEQCAKEHGEDEGWKAP